MTFALYVVLIFFAFGWDDGVVTISTCESSSSISDISDSDECWSFRSPAISLSPAAFNWRSSCRTAFAEWEKRRSIVINHWPATSCITMHVSIILWHLNTYFAGPIDCFAVSSHRFPIGGFDFFASWMLCIRRLFSKFALGSPAAM